MAKKKILLVDDEKLIRWTLSQAVNEWNYAPIEAGDVKNALHLFETEQPDMIFLDINLPDGSGIDALRLIKQRQPDANVVIITANALVDNTIAALRAGACDFLVKPIDLDKVHAVIEHCLEKKKPDNPRVDISGGFDLIVGKSAKMQSLINLTRKIARSDVSTILLQGETGTGKELFARAIHQTSKRAVKPFVAINCSSIPANLVESELFGHEKGAFTDAKAQKKGLFEQAQGGTIFLDEIGEMEYALQAKLLRVFEENAFRRVGGLKDLSLDVRIISASNRDLRSEFKNGIFRQDLYFRLSTIEIDIPPLRERGKDILRLAAHFIKKLDRPRYRDKARRLSPEAVKVFCDYDWTGNVRELRNVIERALILEEGDEITLNYLPPALTRNLNYGGTAETAANFHLRLPSDGISLDDVEESLIEQALKRNQGNITQAAKTLNLTRSQLRYRLRKKASES